MAISDKDFYASHGISFDIEEMQIEYTKRVIRQAKIEVLTEIQLEIKELWDNRYDVWLDNQYYLGKSDTLEEVDEVIQQKIDKLEE